MATERPPLEKSNKINCPINAALEYGLSTLNTEKLKSNLKDLLSDEQIKAPLKHRYQILELCSGNEQ